jgi:hypothetical protein
MIFFMMQTLISFEHEVGVGVRSGNQLDDLHRPEQVASKTKKAPAANRGALITCLKLTRHEQVDSSNLLHDTTT